MTKYKNKLIRYIHHIKQVGATHIKRIDKAHMHIQAQLMRAPCTLITLNRLCLSWGFSPGLDNLQAKNSHFYISSSNSLVIEYKFCYHQNHPWKFLNSEYTKIT